MSEDDISSLKISNIQTDTFQKPVSGKQECRNLHDFGCSTGIRQAFRSIFFTYNEILEYLTTSPAVLVMLSPTFRLLCLIDTLRAAPRHSESAAKWILMVL